MNLHQLKNTDELQPFFEGSQAIAFSLPTDKDTRYRFIQDVLKQFHYRALKKSQKGIVIRFLIHVTVVVKYFTNLLFNGFPEGF